MTARKRWSADESLAAFDLYLRTPFGQQHSGHPPVMELARHVGRTPSAVAMKLNNFSGLDPTEIARGIKGLANRSKADEQLFRDFETDPTAVALAASEAFDAVTGIAADHTEPEPHDKPSPRLDVPVSQTEREAVVRVRRVQRSFRNSVLAAYEHRCALTGCSASPFLVASHIVPWRDAGRRRADPRNGLCLNVLHDRAFDRGLISFDESFSLIVSPSRPDAETFGELADQFRSIEGRRLRDAVRFAPDQDALKYHRDHVFVA